MARADAGIDDAHQIGCVRLRNREGTCTCKKKPPTQVLKEVLTKMRCECSEDCRIIDGATVEGIVDEFHQAMSTNG